MAVPPVFFSGELAPITAGMTNAVANQDRRAAANDVFLNNVARNRNDLLAGRMQYQLGMGELDYRNRAFDEEMIMRRKMLDEQIRQFTDTQKYLRENLAEMSTAEKNRLKNNLEVLDANIKGLQKQTETQGSTSIEVARLGQRPDPGLAKLYAETKLTDDDEYKQAESLAATFNAMVINNAIQAYGDLWTGTEAGAQDMLNTGVYNPTFKKVLGDSFVRARQILFSDPSTAGAAKYLKTDPNTYQVTVDPTKKRGYVGAPDPLTPPAAGTGGRNAPPSGGTNSAPAAGKVIVKPGDFGYDATNHTVVPTVPSAAVSRPLESTTAFAGTTPASAPAAPNITPGGGFFENYFPALTANPFMPTAQAGVPTNGLSGEIQRVFSSPSSKTPGHRGGNGYIPVVSEGYGTNGPWTPNTNYVPPAPSTNPLQYPYIGLNRRESTPEDDAYFDQFERNVRRNEAYETGGATNPAPSSVDRNAFNRYGTNLPSVRVPNLTGGQAYAPSPSGLLGPSTFDQPAEPYYPFPPLTDTTPVRSPYYSPYPPTVPIPLGEPYSPWPPSGPIPLGEPPVLPSTPPIRPRVIYDPTAPYGEIPMPAPPDLYRPKTGSRSALSTPRTQSPRGAANSASWGRRMRR